MANLTKLRTQHTTFTYSSYDWQLTNQNTLHISFLYTIDPDITFTPSLTISSVTQELIDRLGSEVIDAYVFQIGLAELFSYWKTTAAAKIVIAAGVLEPTAAAFWHKLLLKGMGEFFYQNTIDFSDPNFVTITSQSNEIHQKISRDINTHTTQNIVASIHHPKPTILIPMGGGKDSATTLEILKKEYTVGTLVISAPQSAQDIIKIAEIPQERRHTVTRVLDPKLFELNAAGYLNGHVPISAYLAFVSLLTADLFEYSHVAISNERSSNEGNVWYCDQEINHQYSKTYEFEHDLHEYVAEFLPAQTPEYFSFLRPLYELQIAAIFSQFPQYHTVFKSCNRGQKENTWCGNCSKCLFAWTILFPFLGPEKLTAFFGKNLYTDLNLWKTTQELLGLKTTKPFDCVGTHEETTLAFYLAVQHYKKHAQPLPILLEKVAQELENNQKLTTGPDGQSNFSDRVTTLISDWNSQHYIPEQLAALLQKSLQDSKVTGAL